MPRLPLIEDLTTGPIPAGSQLLVEYDPASQWYNASLTIMAEWLKTGGTGTYHTYARPPDLVRSQFKRLGVDTDSIEKAETREWPHLIYDWYTLATGMKSEEQYAPSSLKVADFSIDLINWMKGPPAPNRLIICDDESTLARFNDEKAWIEFELTRTIPGARMRKITQLIGLIVGVHDEWVYKRLESAADGVLDFKIDEIGDETRDLMRIRTMRNVGFDRRWHAIKIGKNFEVMLVK